MRAEPATSTAPSAREHVFVEATDDLATIEIENSDLYDQWFRLHRAEAESKASSTGITLEAVVGSGGPFWILTDRLASLPTTLPPTLTVSDRELAISSALRTADIDHALARLKSFKNYSEDWDGEGASAPQTAAIDAAIDFLRRLQPWHPKPSSTLDRQGNPVIEFRDGDSDLFGKMRFVAPNSVEIFAIAGQESHFVDGVLDSMEVLGFLSDYLQISVQQ